MRLILFIVGLFATLSVSATISDTDSTEHLAQIREVKRYAPDFLTVQHAGNIGFISGGAGWANRHDRLTFSLLYGYTPASVSGTRIHHITNRNTLNIAHLRLSHRATMIPYASLAISLEVGGKSFLFQPSNMPRGYYDFPKSTHAIVGGGLKHRQLRPVMKYFRGIEMYAEAGTIDAYIWYKLRSDEVKMNDIMSVSLGINLLRK